MKDPRPLWLRKHHDKKLARGEVVRHWWLDKQQVGNQAQPLLKKPKRVKQTEDQRRAALGLLPKSETVGRLKTKRVKKLRARLPPFCLRCGATECLTLDHILPRSKGGGNNIENLRLLCGSCNQQKGSQLDQFAHTQLLTQQQVNDLPTGTRVIVTWSGSGPWLYELRCPPHGPEAWTLDLPGDQCFIGFLNHVGSERSSTLVSLPAPA